MRLEAGTPAPAFDAQTIAGQRVSLSDFAGRRVWLSFFRYAACPLCSFRIHELITQWDERFAGQGFELLTVWQSPPEKLQEIVDRYSPPFHLITDPELALYRSYSVEKGAFKVFGKEVFSGIAGARQEKSPVGGGWDGAPTRRPA
ncbi:MAG: redoxin domain-containing protein, partial [Myxococcota bacterium]